MHNTINNLLLPLVNMRPTESFLDHWASPAFSFLSLIRVLWLLGTFPTTFHMERCRGSYSSLPGPCQQRKALRHLPRAVGRQLLHREDVGLGGTSRITQSLYRGVGKNPSCSDTWQKQLQTQMPHLKSSTLPTPLTTVLY